MTKLQSWRWPRVAAAFVLTLAVLVAGWYWHGQWSSVKEPLAALQQVGGVRTVTIDGRTSPPLLTVRLGPVADLATTYGQVIATAAHYFGGSGYTLQLYDSRTPVLTAADYQVHFLAEQAAATGMFGDLPAEVRQVLGSYPGVSDHLWVTDCRVYVQLTDGGGQLDDVVGRPGSGGGCEYGP